ncbi:MAG TPA: hypothetical protein VMC06_14850, partial [Opitutaceae bacterium]|nr:hypothetical protein [Opitutaceae bacterium]
ALDYYSEQVMDNLIRAKNGMLFLHVDVTQLTAQVTTKGTGVFNGGQSKVGTNTANVLLGNSGTTSSAALQVTKPLSFSLTPERDDMVTLQAVPEVNDSQLYALYLKFLNTDQNEADLKGNLIGSKIVTVVGSDTPPRDGTYVPGTATKWGGAWYYIPGQYQQQYQNLCVGIVARQKPRQGAESQKTTLARVYNPEEQMEALAPKNDSVELRTLRQLQQTINSLQK